MKMWEPTECPGTEELKDRLQTAREKLARQQMLLKEKKLPVLVLMEGWGTAGKGNCIGRVIQNIDPRFFNVESLEKKTEEEKRKPFLYRYFKRLPEAGKFAFFDSGWMDEIVNDCLHGKMGEKEYKRSSLGIGRKRHIQIGSKVFADLNVSLQITDIWS